MAATEETSEQKLKRIVDAMQSGHVRLEIVRLLHFGDGPKTQDLGVRIFESGLTKGGNQKWTPLILMVPNDGETVADTLHQLGVMAVDGG